MQRNGHDLVKRDYVLPDAKINPQTFMTTGIKGPDPP